MLCTGAAHHALCPACLAELPEQQPAEEVLGVGTAPEGRSEAPPLQQPAKSGQRDTVTAFTLWRYVEPADHVLLGFKYGGHATVAQLWAARVAGRLPAVDAVIAMPMHPTRLAERGENPAAVMARVLRPLLPGRPRLVAATKTRITAHQQGLDREGRLANVAGAYRIEADLRGQRVLLVDDVLTTGASFMALAEAARAAGAARICAVAMARAVP